jgi:hypothetical protein
MKSDDQLIYEAYLNTIFLQESSMGDIIKTLKGYFNILKNYLYNKGITKDNIFTMFKQFKQLSEIYFESFIIALRLFVTYNQKTGVEFYDKLLLYITIMIFNIISFPTAVLTVYTIQKGIDFYQDHKEAILEFIDKIEDSTSNVAHTAGDAAINVARSVGKETHNVIDASKKFKNSFNTEQ